MGQRGGVGRARAVAVALTVAVAASGCAGVGSGHPDEVAPSAPTWTDWGAPEGTVSFADGSALASATEVTFANSLGDVWDWQLVGSPDATTTSASPPVTLEMVNTGNGCRVRDERATAEGAGGDDDAASTALVEGRLAGARVVAGPARDLVGLGEPLGEDGPTLAVARALGQEADGSWLLVTARAFLALGVQQVLTVHCPTGEGIDLTQAQLAMNAYTKLWGLERLP